MENKVQFWCICKTCHGDGKKSIKRSQKVKRLYELALTEFEKSDKKGEIPKLPKRKKNTCSKCGGSGLTPTNNQVNTDKNSLPHIAIIGGGIAGVALAVACLYRGIPFTLYERDKDFNTRSQGYGLTLQQASKAMKGFGLFDLDAGIISTKHIVHDTSGKIIGEWGMRKWLELDHKETSKRSNIHIARQSLRLALLNQLSNSDTIKWGHQLINIKTSLTGKANLEFRVKGEIKNTSADLIVGADGIRSMTRKLLIGENKSPLRYLDCIVILGICPLNKLNDLNSTLLDGATVFQTANGHERIYMMPYSKDAIMWQLSFPIHEDDAINLNKKGPKALKEEAQRRTLWHAPIPQIIAATEEHKISGYPVYDRELLTPDLLAKNKQITLIGDAAHPMSPFKGQGANQALLDALALARGIYKKCNTHSNWKEVGLRKTVLTDFEIEMLKRSSKKVQDSAEAAQFLHSKSVLHKSNKPRRKET